MFVKPIGFFGPAATGESLLLDDYPGSVAAWSICRKLKGSYEGNCIRVLRDSDSAEIDIGFDGNGNLDINTLTAHTTTSNGRVMKVYDQSGNGNDLVLSNWHSATLSYYPTIVSVGVLEKINGKVAAFNPPGPTANGGVTMWDTTDPITDSVVWHFGVQYWSSTLPGALPIYNYCARTDLGHNNQWYAGMRSIVVAAENDVGNALEYYKNGSIIPHTSTYDTTEIHSAFGINEQTLATISDLDFTDSDWSDGMQIAGWNTQYGPEPFWFQEQIMWNSDQASSQTGIETNINTYYSIYDADAEAFFGELSTAGVPLSDGDQLIITTLVESLKTANLWDKFYAIWPMIGGSADSTKFNLKDPQDTDAAYRITWAGSPTFSSTGVIGGTTAKYGDTHFIPATNLTSTDSSSYHVYTRGSFTDTQNSWCDMGCFSGPPYKYCTIFPGNSGSQYWDGDATNFISVAGGFATMSPTKGLFSQSRETSTSFKGYKNGIQMGATNTNVRVGGIIDAIFLLARNQLSTHQGSASSRENAFAAIGDGLTDAEASTFYDIVQAYQTSLGREV